MQALRESGKRKGIEFELGAVIDARLDSGVVDGGVLIAFARAVVGADEAALVSARAGLVERLGGPGLIAAALIAAGFSMVDRAANGIGIAVESMVLGPSSAFRERLGLNAFRSARNSLD